MKLCLIVDCRDLEEVERQVKAPHGTSSVDRAAAERYGLKPSNVRVAAAKLLAGLSGLRLLTIQSLHESNVFGAHLCPVVPIIKCSTASR